MSGKRKLQAQLHEISQILSRILAEDTDEKIMMFTDDSSLMELCGQINRLLLDRQRMKAEYRRQELASRKMLSNISHDLKTPLTVILGYLEIMHLERPDDINLQKVEEKATQVMELINQFFTLAKLEAGDMNTPLSRINLSELCRENILDFYDILRQKDFEVDISIPEHDYYAWGNAEAIERILSNLISNAVRYGSDGHYIGLSLSEEENSVSFHVIDKGKGIEKEFISHIFERLYTMEDSRSREIQGNGLGLTIAKNLTEQLGGVLTVESTPHVKTIFTVKLRKFSH